MIPNIMKNIVYANTINSPIPKVIGMVSAPAPINDPLYKRSPNPSPNTVSCKNNCLAQKGGVKYTIGLENGTKLPERKISVINTNKENALATSTFLDTLAIIIPSPTAEIPNTTAIKKPINNSNGPTKYKPRIA